MTIYDEDDEDDDEAEDDDDDDDEDDEDDTATNEGDGGDGDDADDQEDEYDDRVGDDECDDCDDGDDCFVCNRFRTEPTSLRSTVRIAPDPSSTEQGISCSANVLSCSLEPCGKCRNQPPAFP